MTAPRKPSTPDQSGPTEPQESQSPQPASPEEDPGWLDGLRGPRGCAEWTVVILGVIWVVLAVVFVIALVARLSG